MRVYVAAPFELRAEARALAASLVEAGHESAASWLGPDANEQNMVELASDPEGARKCAEYAARDLAEVAGSDALVLINPPEFARAGTGGRLMEAQHALTLGLPVVLVGARTNVFLFHPAVVAAPAEQVADTLPLWAKLVADKKREARAGESRDRARRFHLLE